MAALTWKGEDELHGPGNAGPSFTTWNGIKFPVGVAVEVSDPEMIRRARGNKFFAVDEPDKPRRGRPPKMADLST